MNDHRTAPTVDHFAVEQGSTAKSATFIFGNEDHTLGNALRFILVKKEDKTGNSLHIQLHDNSTVYNHEIYITMTLPLTVH